MAPQSDQLSIQSFFGIQGQGRQVVELVKAKRGRPPKPRPAAQPAQEGLATAQQEGREAAEQEEQAAAQQEEAQQQHKRARKGRTEVEGESEVRPVFETPLSVPLGQGC